MFEKEKYSSYKDLLEQSIKRTFPIYGNDDQSNRFEVVSLPSQGYLFGLAYCNYGVEPQILLVKSKNNLLIGFEETVIGLDYTTQIEIFRKKDISPFYEFITTKYCILAVFELGIYAYNMELTQIWSLGFRDVVVNYHVVNDENLMINCANGDQSTFSLKDGSPL